MRERWQPPIRSDDAFQLTVEDVVSAINTAQREVKVDGEVSEVPHHTSQGALAIMQRELEALTSGSPEDVLAKARKIFDTTQERVGAGIAGDKLYGGLLKEFPDLVYHFSLLRKTPWGYRLTHAVTASRAYDKHQQKNG